MFKAYGLYSHINANRLRSGLLLLGFVALLQMLLFSLFLATHAFLGGDLDAIFSRAFESFRRNWLFALLGAGVWFLIALAYHHRMIRSATRAASVVRAEEPQLYALMEELCISRGVTMPRLEVIETPALNAYAAGLREGSYVVAVTRGLLQRLNEAELRAVLAHELTHIRNRDTQLMVVAVIFAGMFGFIGDRLIGGWDFPYGASPRSRPLDSDGMGSSPGGIRVRLPRSGGGDGGRGNGAAVLIALAVAVLIIVISWGLSTLIRFALSRSREYLADAGAVELTKDPDAMIAALRKIERQATFEVPSRMEAFFIENPVRQRLSGWLATHPPIPDRIKALQTYAGGRVAAEPAEPIGP
ncbi:MAG: M48 family metallopeptidase [Pseudomonadota bacterium]